ncbi:MAG TPA: hypothetical protein VFV38_25325 [Ktedonobacteraceae bacterium]|nr:hypothetical protein [Ktedonobacteraceae bacterium]
MVEHRCGCPSDALLIDSTLKLEVVHQFCNDDVEPGMEIEKIDRSSGYKRTRIIAEECKPSGCLLSMFRLCEKRITQVM